MNPADVVFLYLPISYWAAFALLLYRHDLSRLLHPARDDGSLRNWWAVLSYLGILDKGARRPSRMKGVLPYVVSLSVSAGVSLSWILRLFPVVWYYLIIVQGISGIILTAATIRYLGAPPRRPFVDVLRYPRLGSRIRHLPKVSSLEEADGHQTRQPGAQVSSEPQAAILDGREKSD